VLGGYLILGFRVLPSVLGFGENLRIQEPPVLGVLEIFKELMGSMKLKNMLSWFTRS
jgi:hypothetical protein